MIKPLVCAMYKCRNCGRIFSCGTYTSNMPRVEESAVANRGRTVCREITNVAMNTRPFWPLLHEHWCSPEEDARGLADLVEIKAIDSPDDVQEEVWKPYP